MYFSDEINLITVSKRKNELNQYREEYTKQSAYAELKTISSREMADAGVAGHLAEGIAVIHQEDYNGQELVEIIEKHKIMKNGIYRVYRIYAKQDVVELYLKNEVTK